MPKNFCIKKFIICEGYTDVICLHSHGYPAVASLGTALAEDQIETIFSMVDEAFLVLMVILLVKMLLKSFP